MLYIVGTLYPGWGMYGWHGAGNQYVWNINQDRGAEQTREIRGLCWIMQSIIGRALFYNWCEYYVEFELIEMFFRLNAYVYYQFLALCF